MKRLATEAFWLVVLAGYMLAALFAVLLGRVKL